MRSPQQYQPGFCHCPSPVCTATSMHCQVCKGHVPMPERMNPLTGGPYMVVCDECGKSVYV